MASTDQIIAKIKWPPAWNPFHVFLLGLALISTLGLLRGQSGSQVLDDHLNDLAVTMWGAALGVGCLLDVIAVFCYRSSKLLMPGLYLERAGLALVGTSAAIYTVVVLLSAPEVDGVRYTAAVQTGFALACFFRAWQAHVAIRLAHQLYGAFRARAGSPDDA